MFDTNKGSIDVRWLLIRTYVLSISFFFGGCATGIEGFPSSDSPDPAARNFITYLAPEDVVRRYYSSTSDSERQVVRNAFIFNKITEIDQNYQEFKKRLYFETVAGEVGADYSIAGVALAGTIVNSASTSRILHAVIGTISGAKATYQKSVLYDQTQPALLALMDARRESVKVAILGGMSSPTTKYPLLRAQDDLQRYYFVGTIPGAIKEITQTAGEVAEQAREDAEAVTNVTFRVSIDNNSRLLSKFLIVRRDGRSAFDPANLASFNLCANRNNIDIGPLRKNDDPTKGNLRTQAIIVSEGYALQREIIVACLRNMGRNI